MFVKADMTHLRSGLGAWGLIIGVAICVFCSRVYDQLQGDEPLLGAGGLQIFGVALYLFAFGIGDAGVLRSLSRTIRCRQTAVRLVARRYLLLDCVLALAHLVLLNLLALSVGAGDEIYLRYSSLLLAINMIWLGVRLKHFNSVYERVAGRTRRALFQLRDTMLSWQLLNGTYLLFTCIAIGVADSTGHDATSACVWATIVRSLADLFICRKYYGEVLSSYFAVPPGAGA